MHTSYYFSMVNGEVYQVIEKWVFFKLLQTKQTHLSKNHTKN
jgi:hypothetical protein